MSARNKERKYELEKLERESAKGKRAKINAKKSAKGSARNPDSASAKAKKARVQLWYLLQFRR
jgi:hypothetical protein